MYISRMGIAVRSLSAARLMGSPYRLHAAVEGAFGPEAVRSCDEGRILWRLDDAPGEDEVWLYIVSPERPNLSDISDQVEGGLVTEHETKSYDRVLTGIREGQIWQFRLKANPVRRVLLDKGRRPNSKVVGTLQAHVTEEQQQGWLLDRAESHGFRICTDGVGQLALRVSKRVREQFHRGSNSKSVTIATAQFDGVLEVTDAAAFAHALGHGIGRAKGFGCGLITIAPVPAPSDRG